MRLSFIFLSCAAAIGFAALPAFAQSSAGEVGALPAAYSAPKQAQRNPDYCINILAEFPADDNEIRYQFLRLTEEMARDMTPDFRNALDKYGDWQISADSSMLGVIEDIANPVLRQAAPEITVANMAYVIDFATICEPFISGQIKSLEAFDGTLTEASFNAVIVDDALFLRQILSDSMHRLGADGDALFAGSVAAYSRALVTTRDAAEFLSFEDELGDLEALYMDDLDGRLKRSNDVINEEMDTEVLGDAIALNDSLMEAEKRKAKERQIYSLIRILGGGG